MFWASPLAGLCVLRHGACSVSKNSCGPYDCHDTHTFLSPSKHVFVLSCRLHWASLSVGGPWVEGCCLYPGSAFSDMPSLSVFSPFPLYCFHFYSLFPFLTLSLYFPRLPSYPPCPFLVLCGGAALSANSSFSALQRANVFIQCTQRQQRSVFWPVF